VPWIVNRTYTRSETKSRIYANECCYTVGQIDSDSFHNPVPKNPLMRIRTGLLTLALIFAPAFLFAKDLQHQSLFKIERSKNANIIQYDAQIGSNGKLLKKEPVIGYWIRLAEQGQIQELSWIQSTFAFGFKAKYNQTNDTARVDMVADIGQPITVQSVEGKYIATVDLDGTPSQLVKIYIQAHGKGVRVTVEYVEIFGKDLKTGEETYARIIP